LENLKKIGGLESTGIKERIMFKMILKKYDQGHGIFIRGRGSTSIFCCEKVREFLSSIKREKFIDRLKNQYLLINNCILGSEIV
jgi:hypothetical protein